MKKPIKLNRHALLTVELWSERYPRWIIQNYDETYWSEQEDGFVEDRAKATKYENVQAASAETQELLKRAYAGPGMRKVSYVTPLVIDVFGDQQDLTEEDIIEYLQKVLSLQSNSFDYGNGPNGHLILPRLSFRGFQKRKRRRKKP